MTETLTIWLAGLWLLWLPGVAIHQGLVRLGLRPTPDALHSAAIQIGLGLAVWPILFLWTSTLGMGWHPRIAQITVLGLGAVGLGCLLSPWAAGWRGWLARLRRHSVEILAWGALILLTVNSRLAQIRELVLPNWVDSVHHAMILRIFVDGGHLPATFAPFLPNNNFLYHWGYHANAAWLAWLLGWSDPFQLTSLMLHFGQLLNSLTLIMVYAAARTLFHSRRAGMLAAVLAVLVSWYPAFYVSWGRYTQLSGLLIMAPFMIQLWSLHRTRRMTAGDLLAVILLGGGLVLIHVRVAFFAITLGIVLAGAVVLEERWRSFGRWTLAGLGIVAISGPWLWRLVSSSWIQRFYAPVPVVDPNPLFSDYNAIQWGLVWVPRNHELFTLATGGLSGLLGWGDPSQPVRIGAGIWLGLLVGVSGWMLLRHSAKIAARSCSSRVRDPAGLPQKILESTRRVTDPARAKIRRVALLVGFSANRSQKSRSSQVRDLAGLHETSQRSIRQPAGSRTRLEQIMRESGRNLSRVWGPVLILWAWVGVTAVLLNLEVFGLPSLRISNNNAGVITLFVPLALAGGGLLAWVLGRLAPKAWAFPVTALVAVGIGAWAGPGMGSVVNPVTTLARPPDLPALAWVRENVPEDALFATRPWLWLGDIYAGVDGGYWLPILTDRRSVLPTALYNIGTDQASFDAANEMLAALAAATDLDDPALRARLAAAGVTHLYIGPREGNGFQIDRLRNSPHARLIYEQDGAAVFEFLP
ncbi:MAG: hypothetical protein KBG20_21875 [Caldilineaceae bacterium]|nr:hypothetical protein [Caldilineaceae bacterium]MBP8124643.1 hypothetical protein [Caldilineaceae bacterium]MBP9074972.1 hypothetical protein [Caldilineaceae bacterium]